ncbi:MAG: TVP38/TMEM64 family protein [Deltaproteobacteria bacterium]|nr:TVP38/TMEM64 family protein [Deltaproteobacteria bacterium]
MNTSAKNILLPLTLLACITLAAWIIGRAAVFDPAVISEFIEGFGPWGPLVYILVYSVAPSLMLPGLPLTLASGVLFGPVYGIIYTSIGATIGSSVAFLIARRLGRRWVFEKIIRGSRLEEIDMAVLKHGWKAVAVARLIPLIPFNALNYALGLTGVRFSHFAGASFVFMLPGITAYVLLADSLGSVIGGKAGAPYMLMAAAALVIILMLIAAAWRRKTRQ